MASCACFLAFCAACSAVYLVNDVFDRATDARHPVKRARPIASGRLPAPVAGAAAVFLAIAALGGAAALSLPVLLIVAASLASSAGYGSGLKSVSIVCYALYTQSPRTVENFHTTSLVYTVPFVIYALFRHQHLVLRENGGGDPGSSLLRDRGMMAAIIGWAAAAAAIVYAR